MELRKTRYWGRLYLDGWPQPIQYFLAHFGSPPEMEERPILVADPPTACEPLKNAQDIR
jgi:hypothetical protein